MSAWRTFWLHIPLRHRQPLRDAALWLRDRLRGLAAWLDLHTVGTLAEALDAMDCVFFTVKDEPDDKSFGISYWIKGVGDSETKGDAT